MRQQGFTMLELLIAMAVLSVGILGVMNLMIVAVSAVGDTKERVIAANLAQEGVEIVLGIRNTNWIVGDPYDDGLGTGTWCADASDQVVSACASHAIYWNGSLFTHESGEDTDFSRRVVIAPGSDGTNPFLRVQSIVEWNNESIVAETHLYDWR